MVDLKNKDKSIVDICNNLSQIVGLDYFDSIDFWEGDACAIGLKKENKLIYISTWDSDKCNGSDMKYYFEFEFIDTRTLETKVLIKSMTNATKEQLINDIIDFLTNQG